MVSHSLRQIIEGLSSSLVRGAEMASTEEPDAMADKGASIDYNPAIQQTSVAVTESLLMDRRIRYIPNNEYRSS